VYHYAGGEVDWAANGLPVEGQAARKKVIGPLSLTDVPTCELDDRVGDVAARVREAGWDTCVVVNRERVVLGRLFDSELNGPPDLAAGDAMRAGSSTYRPNVSVEELLPKLQVRGWHTALVTTPDGRLIGVIRDDDLLRALEDELGA
jgi:CBS domain-containing protein